jgi:hypothetical protein
MIGHLTVYTVQQIFAEIGGGLVGGRYISLSGLVVAYACIYV